MPRDWFKHFFKKISDALFPEKKRWVDFSLYSGEKMKLLDDIPRARPLIGRFVEKGLETSVAVLSYKHPIARALIWQIKYKKDREALRCGGFLLHRKILTFPSSAIPLFIFPIPTSPARRRERGYNQCELLANTVVEIENANRNSAQSHFQLRFDVLIRQKNTARQATINRQERLHGANHIFAVSQQAIANAPIPFDARIIVLDDVVTTGSTLKAALDVLRDAGFTNVRGLALAH